MSHINDVYLRDHINRIQGLEDANPHQMRRVQRSLKPRLSEEGWSTFFRIRKIMTPHFRSHPNERRVKYIAHGIVSSEVFVHVTSILLAFGAYIFHFQVTITRKSGTVGSRQAGGFSPVYVKLPPFCTNILSKTASMFQSVQNSPVKLRGR